MQTQAPRSRSDWSSSSRKRTPNLQLQRAVGTQWRRFLLLGAATATDILTVGGIVSGTGTGLTKVGAGTVILTAANSYDGPTVIDGGTLQLGNGTATGTLNLASAITVNTGGTFAVNQTDTVTQGTDFSASAITGAGGLAQTGTGSTILSTIGNSYSGGTTVSNGELRVTGSLTGAGAVTVGETGGTLTNAAILAGAGNGTTTGIIAGAVTVGSPTSVGILTPGADSTNAQKGTLTLTHNNTALTVADGSQIQFGITIPTITTATNYALGVFTYNGTDYTIAKDYFDAIAADVPANDIWTNATPSATANHDYINLTGTTSTLSVGNRAGGAFGQGSILVNAVTLGPVQYGQVFNLLDWSGASLSGNFDVGAFNRYDASSNVIAGDLDLAMLGAGFAWDVSAFQTYGILVVVPEPSRMLLLMFGLLGLMLRRRRRSGI